MLCKRHLSSWHNMQIQTKTLGMPRSRCRTVKSHKLFLTTFINESDSYFKNSANQLICCKQSGSSKFLENTWLLIRAWECPLVIISHGLYVCITLSEWYVLHRRILLKLNGVLPLQIFKPFQQLLECWPIFGFTVMTSHQSNAHLKTVIWYGGLYMGKMTFHLYIMRVMKSRIY